MRHLKRLGNSFNISLPTDEEGYTGRQCPNPDCEGYFKITFGTGLPDVIDCYCPYCGHTADQSEFHTPEQIEYAQSIVARQITDAIYKDFKEVEFDIKPQGDFGIGLGLKVKRDRPISIQRYREKELETQVICENCSLRYTVYGVFAYCPDCGQHNSLQILKKDFEVIEKQLDLASKQESPLKEILVEDTLENCVSKFDGFGRNLCRAHKKKAKEPAKAENISFQNITGAREKLKDQFGVEIAQDLASSDWGHIVLCFQKRHVLEHNKGVIDQDYVKKSGDTSAVVGRKLKVDPQEVKELVALLDRIASNLMRAMESIK